MLKKVLYSFVTILIVILSACGVGNEGYVNVSSEEAKQILDEKGPVVLDVRTPAEFQEGHIPNAKLIPLQDLEKSLSNLNKDETYLIVCRSGNRSTQASELLTQNGFTNVYNMDGGMNSWSYEIEK